MKNRNKPITTIILLALGVLALSSIALAVSPPPDGGYAGGNTAEGQNALLRLTSGTYNTAIGFDSLLSLNTGILCTGVGVGSLALLIVGATSVPLYWCQSCRIAAKMCDIGLIDRTLAAQKFLEWSDEVPLRLNNATAFPFRNIVALRTPPDRRPA